MDNIPGVPGVGKKTASALLDAFDCIESALSNPEDIAGLSIRGAKKLAERLTQHRDTIDFALRLTEIPESIDMELPLSALQPQPRDQAGLETFFSELGMGRQMLSAIRAIKT